MKSYVLTLVAMLLTSANVNAAPIKAAVVCQQQDGDQWFEAAIVPVGFNFNLAAVYHDTDDGSSTLIYNKPGSKVKTVAAHTENQTTLYSDNFGGYLMISDADDTAIVYLPIRDKRLNNNLSDFKCRRDTQFNLPE